MEEAERDYIHHVVDQLAVVGFVLAARCVLSLVDGSVDLILVTELLPGGVTRPFQT